jgi:hypothetical protein
MSYICEHTGKIIGPGIPENKIIVKRRKKVYEKPPRQDDEHSQAELIEGWEIAKEIRVGPEAYRELTGEEPQLFKRSAVQFTTEPVEEEPPRKHKPRTNPKWRKQASQQQKRVPVVEVVNPLRK